MINRSGILTFADQHQLDEQGTAAGPCRGLRGRERRGDSQLATAMLDITTDYPP
jgi:hypothetical protein